MKKVFFICRKDSYRKNRTLVIPFISHITTVTFWPPPTTDLLGHGNFSLGTPRKAAAISELRMPALQTLASPLNHSFPFLTPASSCCSCSATQSNHLPITQPRCSLFSWHLPTFISSCKLFDTYSSPKAATGTCGHNEVTMVSQGRCAPATSTFCAWLHTPPVPFNKRQTHLLPSLPSYSFICWSFSSQVNLTPSDRLEIGNTPVKSECDTDSWAFPIREDLHKALRSTGIFILPLNFEDLKSNVSYSFLLALIQQYIFAGTCQ